MKKAHINVDESSLLTMINEPAFSSYIVLASFYYLVGESPNISVRDGATDDTYGAHLPSKGSRPELAVVISSRHRVDKVY